MVTKKVHENGSITWTYENLEELSNEMKKAAENPYRVDIDLEMKDKMDEWNDR